MSAGAPQTPPVNALANERGSVLVISLLMLVLFSLVGGTLLTLSSTEGQIAKNHQVGTQALYVAEAGLQTAYREFSASNFQAYTHTWDWNPAVGNPLQITLFGGNLVLDTAGDNGLQDERDDNWYVWEWNPGDPGTSLTGSNQSEQFRFAVRPVSGAADEDEFTIDAIGTLGKFNRQLRAQGYAEPAFTYALFSDGHLSEFTRGADQNITGKVHANGDLFFRPWNPYTLSIDSPSITATGRMVRTTDIFGRDLHSGSTVRIKDADGNWVEMALGSPGNAMDSENAGWTNDNPTDSIDGALELWDGIVRDGSLGAASVDPPPVEAVQNGGYYDQRASLRIRAGDTQVDNAGNDISSSLGSAVTEVRFWNQSIDQYVTVQELDVAALRSSGNWPANGLIYSEVPLRLKNADELGGALTVVGSHSIYTVGHFNRTNKRPAAIISGGRTWHLSSNWQDDDSYTMAHRNNRQAADGTTVINAALVDGQPPVNTANYGDIDGDGQRDDPSAGDAIANNDHLLETWGSSRTLRKLGSIVHLQFADMADNVYNNGMQPHETAWAKHSGYRPPKRDYAYDPSLAGAAGQPPFSPMVAKIYLWQEVGANTQVASP